MKTRHALGFTAVLCLLSASPALADPTRDQVMDGAARCEGIPDNRVWLDCFYGSAQPMRAALGLMPAPDSQTRLVPAPGTGYGAAAYGGGSVAARRAAPAAPKSEGFWSSLVGNTKPLANDMPMTAYGFGRDGRFTVTMSDGHVWEQAELDVRKARWKKPAGSYKVTINNSASPNVYDLRVEGVVYKVMRVR